MPNFCFLNESDRIWYKPLFITEICPRYLAYQMFIFMWLELVQLTGVAFKTRQKAKRNNLKPNISLSQGCTHEVKSDIRSERKEKAFSSAFLFCFISPSCRAFKFQRCGKPLACKELRRLFFSLPLITHQKKRRHHIYRFLSGLAATPSRKMLLLWVSS